MTTPWKIIPITGTFGGEVIDGDLHAAFTAEALRHALHEHRVLVFRGQDLTRAEQVAVGRMLGELTPAHPVVPGDGEFPEILELNAAEGGRNARWHTDVTFMAAPPAYSVLVADHTPASGGDTVWADTQTAYDRLSPVLQIAIDHLSAVHRITPLAYWGEPFDTALTRDDAEALLKRALDVPPVVHPVVRVHPVTGRKALFVNPGFTSHILGVSRIESDGLLRLLYEHASQPELTMRHRWQRGDVAMWDNQATMHYAIDDYGDAPRRMRRVTVRGAAAIGPFGQVSAVSTDPLVTMR